MSVREAVAGSSVRGEAASSRAWAAASGREEAAEWEWAGAASASELAWVWVSASELAWVWVSASAWGTGMW
ncbi:hypothetical protein, partial [Streptomyces sp. SID5770]|uniref:hypothetical protein n=1 Tax=Streptomyces sp. SID5770 TaxID=2690308 RepID=UPI001F2CA02C